VHQRVDIAIDLPKLKRGSKRFSPAKQMRRLQSDLRSKPQRNVTTAKVDASRSSLQAAPCVTFFTGERINKRNPSLADLPSSWHHTAPPPHTYKCRYDPVHNAIRNRDKSVPLALCIIRIAMLMHASRPYIFSRHSSSPQTSGGGRNGDGPVGPTVLCALDCACVHGYGCVMRCHDLVCLVCLLQDCNGGCCGHF
jgi:hypothetical protein